MKLKSVAVAAASVMVGLAATSVQAASTSWGVHDPLESAFVLYVGNAPQVISDEYTFSLASGSVFEIASSLLGGGMPPLSMNLTLKDGWDSPVFSIAINDPTVYTMNLAAGSYKYVVSGSSTGFFGYSLSSSIVEVTPVPEPETYAMMLAGLAALGFLARRRQG